MYRLPIGTYLDEALICKYLRADALDKVRRDKLRHYYEGKHDILNRQYDDPSKPNNRIVNPYPKYISDAFVGYFMGTAVGYTSNDDDVAEAIASITEYNDDAKVCSDLAKYASVEGQAVEVVYIDADKEVRYTASKANHILIYDESIEEELLWCIRYYPIDDIQNNRVMWYVDVYGTQDVRHYKSANPSSALEMIATEPHYFGLVPVAVYRNNEECIGDFEQVISLVDAYDAVQSDAINNADYFTDAYLLMTNAVLDAEDVQNMKTNRVICLPENASASFLIKQGNDAVDENLKNRIKADIHKFSGVPDMSDEQFGNNASGVSLKYKLMQMENIASTKERYFKLGLQRRFELIANISAVMGTGFDWRLVDIQFKRTLPTDESAAVDVVNKLGSLLSDETKIAMLPWDLNAQDEIERKRNEAVEDNNIYFGGNDPFYDNREGNAD